MKRVRPVILFLIGIIFVYMELGCGGFQQVTRPIIPKNNIPADIDVVVKMEIEKRLYSSSTSERKNGAIILGIIGKEAAPAVPFLIDMLKDKNEDVRVNVAIALGKIGDPRAVEPLIAALKDKDEDVRLSVAIALGSIKDPRAVEPLVAVLKDKDEDEEVRGPAVIALGKIGDPRAVEPLITVLKDKDEDEEVRGPAVIALGKIGDPRAVEPLIVVLKDKDEEVRGSAAVALGKIGDPRAVEPLIAALKSIAEYLENKKLVGKNAAVALGKIGDPRAIEPLIAAMKDEEKGVKGDAVAGYVVGGLTILLPGKIDSTQYSKQQIARSSEMLIDIKKRDRGELWSVAWAIANIGKPAVEPLIAALKNKDSHEDIKRRAPVALGKIGDPRAIEPLISALNDKDEDVRLSAAIALGNIKDPRAVEPLIAALKDKDEKVRGSAAIALGKIGGPRAIDPLIALLKDENKNLRWDAAEALGNIKDPRVIELIVSTLKELAAEVKNEHWIVRKAVAERLGMIGKPAVEPLITFLNDEDNEVRLSAAEALGKIKDSRAVEPLIVVLKGEPQMAWINDKVRVDIRVATAIALGNIGDSRAVEPLIAVLKDENVYVLKSAKEALEKISGNNLGYDHAKWQAWWAENKNKQLASPGR